MPHIMCIVAFPDTQLQHIRFILFNYVCKCNAKRMSFPYTDDKRSFYEINSILTHSLRLYQS